jgi:hypothetical protein
MNSPFLSQSLKWGLALWLFGYALGFAFFALLPINVIGWAIMPFGIAATLWVLLRKTQASSMQHYVTLGLIWAAMAIILDYVFIVRLLQPPDGYYKLDVYIYYALTFALPCAAGFWKLSPEQQI